MTINYSLYQLKNILMDEEKLICGQCNAEITEAYIDCGDWAQCYDCYCEEYHNMYHADNNDY